jgi:NAD(P)-dependent dehydrogenase (short-subunit alcohol dehydrogenase family)
MIALVAGSERGLGLALCTLLAARGDRVFATCQQRSPELDALGVDVIEGIDVSSDESVARLAEEVDAPRLELVISNAGVNTYSGGYRAPDPQRMLREYDVNALGAVRLVHTLDPKLGDGAKIAFISTGAGAAVPCDAPAGNEHYGYRMSKGALNVYGASLALDVRERGIAVVLLNPGPMDTKHFRDALAASRSGAIHQAQPAEAVAPALLAQIDALTLETTGRWIDGRGREL